MEQTSGTPKKTGKHVPLWLLLLLCGIIILMTLVISFLVLLRLEVVRCVPVKAPEAEATPAAIAPTTAPSATETQPGTAEQTTPEPVETGEPSGNSSGEATEKPSGEATEPPTAEPTEQPTAVPTEAPTAEPTAKPTPLPDWFWFGGQKIKTGSTSIDGKKLKINGKKNKLTHIPESEVADLVDLCPNLELLELEYCYMDDYEPLGDLAKLKTLKLAYCGEGGGNAIKDIGWVEDLTELRTLSFSHNSIEDTKPLAGLTKLTYLHLAGNPLEDEDLEPIGKLTNLETLYLYDLKKITDVSPLSNLKKLTFLHIGHNSKLKSVKALGKLTKLKYLRLNSTKVADLSYIGNFSALKKLDLEKCPIDTKTVKHLKDCKKLEKIVIDMGNYELYSAILDLFVDGYQLQFLYSWSE